MKCSLFALALCAVLAPAISSGPSYRFDADGMAEFRTIDLNPIGLEPEGVDVRGRWIYVSFNTPNPRENKIYRFLK